MKKIGGERKWLKSGGMIPSYIKSIPRVFRMLTEMVLEI
jgi:hypothetical protein